MRHAVQQLDLRLRVLGDDGLVLIALEPLVGCAGDDEQRLGDSLQI